MFTLISGPWWLRINAVGAVTYLAAAQFHDLRLNLGNNWTFNLFLFVCLLYRNQELAAITRWTLSCFGVLSWFLWSFPLCLQTRAHDAIQMDSRGVGVLSCLLVFPFSEIKSLACYPDGFWRHGVLSWFLCFRLIQRTSSIQMVNIWVHYGSLSIQSLYSFRYQEVVGVSRWYVTWIIRRSSGILENTKKWCNDENYWNWGSDLRTFIHSIRSYQSTKCKKRNYSIHPFY